MSIPNIVFSETEINNLYDALEEIAAGSFQGNAGNTATSLTNAINEITAELNIIQNQLSLANNVNQENLIKRSQLLRMKNEELMNQLRELELIQSNIANKNRMLDQMNNDMINEENNICDLYIEFITNFYNNEKFYIETSSDLKFYEKYYSKIDNKDYITFLFKYSYDLIDLNNYLINHPNENRSQIISGKSILNFTGKIIL
jgi:hypothetical protein